MNLKAQLINAVAGAVVLAAGSTLVGLKVSDARQDDQIERLENLNNSVDGLRSDLGRVDKHLSEIDGRFQGEQDEPRKH